MAQWTQQYRSAWGMYQQFNDNKCINDFANFKDGIEQKISAIGKNTPNDFCKECVKLRKSIIEKDREFKECYARRSKKLNLIEDNVDIKHGNTTGGRDTSEQSVVRQVLAGQDVVTETRDSAVPAGKDFGQTDPSEANADGLEPASADTGVVAATHVDIGNPNSDTVITDSDNSYNAVHGKVVDHDKTSSRDEGIKNSASESSAELGTTHGNISTGGGDHTKGSNVNDAGIETHNNAKSCMETPCSNEQSTQLNAHNSEKLGIFNHISKVLLENQGHMINASIPMGIVMLLTLLFKYTPLWRIFTKRKRNKRSHMNEKLQRVLQQPSIEREERSVPFSYSAFEYSS
ncbi:PIR protein [Plasmodium vivax]|uniref:VIR protein n=1 Tax=Plasmodium vivax TaxID=5855 RepID=A0A565A3S3_PLAVI|nr:PIR protein [Plasmodium vivax]